MRLARKEADCLRQALGHFDGLRQCHLCTRLSVLLAGTHFFAIFRKIQWTNS
jgi:hypothetical protein